MYYLIGLKTCSTCRQIEKLLRQADITYQYQDVRTDRPTADQIRGWLSSINKENIDKLVNTHGQVYRERQLKTLMFLLALALVVGYYFIQMSEQKRRKAKGAK